MSLLLTLNGFHIVLVFPWLTRNKQMLAGDDTFIIAFAEINAQFIQQPFHLMSGPLKECIDSVFLKNHLGKNCNC